MTPPLHPVPAVLAVVLRGTEVLLVRRANPPDAGKWGFPGGRMDWGETLAEATLRELREETGLTARYGEVITALDVLTGPPAAREFHYVLIASRCDWLGGEPVAADDALEARWIALDALPAMTAELSRDVAALARRAALSYPSSAR